MFEVLGDSCSIPGSDRQASHPLGNPYLTSFRTVPLIKTVDMKAIQLSQEQNLYKNNCPKVKAEDSENSFKIRKFEAPIDKVNKTNQ